MTQSIFPFASGLMMLLVTACGGGGGNPGTCSGSAEVCGNGATPTAVASFVGVIDSQLATVTCPDILIANGGDKTRASAAAQDALARGASNLDGAPKNGIACDGVF
jgi:hypothetical protein